MSTPAYTRTKMGNQHDRYLAADLRTIAQNDHDAAMRYANALRLIAMRCKDFIESRDPGLKSELGRFCDDILYHAKRELR